MYEHLKFTIEKLTARMKSPKVLSPADMRKLEVSIEAIIKDARGESQATTERPVSSPTAVEVSRSTSPPMPQQQQQPPRQKQTQEEQDAPSHASASSWIIPGMETMSSEEYYKALNKRIADVKAAKRASGEVVGGR
jgi:hypothetical protein